jgi:pimeloyl-ACP methyl ester carboxylesterase
MTLSSTRIRVGARPTEILTTGAGEPLVFQHGGGIVEGFDFLDDLDGRFRSVAPLLPGYGASELDPPLTGPDDVAAHLLGVLDALGIERTVLVGHSLGGWAAVNFAARYPERVSELVLAAPLGMDVPGRPIANMMALSPEDRLTTLTYKSEVWEGRIPVKPDPAFAAARAREHASMGHFAPGPHDPELKGVLPRITMPALLLWGEGDRLIPVAHLPEWQAALPHASVTTFPGAGHLLFHERPAAIAAVASFVDARRA